MRVLVLSSQASDTGSFIRVQGLARALARMGHEVVAPTPPRSLPFFAHFWLGGIKYRRLAREKFDLVIISKPYPHTAGLVPRFKTLGALCVIDIDDMDWGFRSGPVSRLLKKLELPYPKLADLVTYHNPKLRDLIIREFGVPEQKLYRLDQGVDLELFNPESITPGAVSALRERLGTGDRPYLLWVGNINAAAELEIWLKVFAEASKARPELLMIIAGGGPLLGMYMRKAYMLGLDRKVLFTGPVSRQDVPALMAGAAGCLVFMGSIPGDEFRRSIKLREYLALGRPVICNDGGELGDFRDLAYVCGSSIADLATAVLDLTHNRLDARHQNGPAWARTHCDWNKIASDFMERISPGSHFSQGTRK